MRILVALLLLASPAWAQAPDLPLLQKALSVLEAQRNQASNAHANAEARAALLGEENTKLKAELETLKKEKENEAGKSK